MRSDLREPPKHCFLNRGGLDSAETATGWILNHVKLQTALFRFLLNEHQGAACGLQGATRWLGPCDFGDSWGGTRWSSRSMGTSCRWSPVKNHLHEKNLLTVRLMTLKMFDLLTVRRLMSIGRRRYVRPLVEGFVGVA